MSAETVGDAELRGRIDEWRDDLVSALSGLYPDRVEEVAAAVLRRVDRAAHERRGALVDLDRARERDADWLLRPERMGYAAYADRFAGTLRGVVGRIGYLRELGVDVLHLMSVLESRTGDSDGGYAIDDYRRPDPRLGTVDDLRSLVDSLRDAGISLCLDLVMNHTSADHHWAEAARQGSSYHRGLYLTFPDRVLPDAYEATLPEVFPTMAPGSFTWDDALDAWVWTTFREFQWDLDWANPDVLLEMLDVVLHLANLGVGVLRLDAVAFTWKRLGTSCQNQPEAHLIAQTLRAAVGMAAPATALLAEAVAGPDDLTAYLGRHERQRRECHLAYQNQLMVQGWSMLATRQTGLADVALGRLPSAPAGTTWLTYVRGHDDIGWAIADRDASAVDLDGYAHRRFLADFYGGRFPMSFARGVAFSANPATGDERTCGMTATLTGIAEGLESGDPRLVDLGVARLLLLHALAFGWGGVPVIYMGDELGLGDDLTYLADPLRASDSRWRHRPPMDEVARAARRLPGTVPAAVWDGMTKLAAARRTCPQLHGEATVEVVGSGHPAVFAWIRRHPRFGSLLGLANVDAVTTSVPATVVDLLGGGVVVDLLDRSATDVRRLDAYAVRWLTADATYRTVPAVPR
jgi:amylosucrase